MSGNLAAAVADFLAYKRALGRKYLSEEATLHLLLAFAEEHAVADLADLTPHMLDEFVASRPRHRPRSYNHLIGVLGSFLDWAVAQQRLDASQWHGTRRRDTDRRLPFLFDPSQARRLLEAAAALPDNPRATGRGPTYHAIFALCYGLGLRVGEACALHLNDIDTGRQLLIVHGGKFGKSRLVPFGPRIGEVLARQLERRPGRKDPDRMHRCSLSTACTASTRAARAERSTVSPPTWHSRFPRAPQHLACTACVIPSPSDACFAGTGKAWTHRPDSSNSQPLWAT